VSINTNIHERVHAKDALTAICAWMPITARRTRHTIATYGVSKSAGPLGKLLAENAASRLERSASLRQLGGRMDRAAPTALRRLGKRRCRRDFTRIAAKQSLILAPINHQMRHCRGESGLATPLRDT